MRQLLAITSLQSVSTLFASTMSGGKLYTSSTPQNTELSLEDYEVIDWVQVKGVGNHGETGTTQNLVSYDTWDQVFTDKDKGIANAGDPEIELAVIKGDAGQQLMKDAGKATNKNKYAFMIVRNDAVDGGSPTRLYNRGSVVGPRNPNGRNENFDLNVYQLGLVQEQITVEGGDFTLSGTAPAGTDGVAYTFTPTADGASGSVTYRWYGDDLAQLDLTINAATGAITGTPEAGKVVGVIIAEDTADQRATLRVEITVA